MTTIVLTVIGVFLAVAAAIMVVFYGGEAFNGGSAKADAASITSHLTQIKGAVELYEIATERRAQPGSISYLVPEYVRDMPTNPVGAAYYYDARLRNSSQPATAPQGLEVIVAGLPKDARGTAICTAIAREHGTLGANGAPVVSASLPEPVIGCFESAPWGGVPANLFVSYVKVR